MKVQSTKAWAVVVVTMAGLLRVAGSGRAEEPEVAIDRIRVTEEKVQNNDSLATQKALQVLQQQQRNQSLFSSGTSGGSVGPHKANLSTSIRTAAEAVRDAKGDQKKAAAQKTLADLLAKSFDSDMIQREKEVKQIEERLAKLRELLDRRRSKKQEILELQTKVALNEADGLGFYDSEPKPVPAFGWSGATVRGNSSSTGLILSTPKMIGAPTGLPEVPAVPAAAAAPAAAPAAPSTIPE